jgi:hypothetical protein
MLAFWALENTPRGFHRGAAATLGEGLALTMRRDAW